MTADAFRWVVAVPAKDEAELLPKCLSAIGAQADFPMDELAVVVSCNNCRDDSAQVVRAMAPTLPFKLIVDEVALPQVAAHAGGARRSALDSAAAICARDGVLITTDADGRPDPQWLLAFREAFEPDIAAVAGRVSTDWDELSQFPTAVLEVGTREWEYQGLCAELEALCDPEAHDPWPRHNQTCGANFAITRCWYETAGRLPVMRTGEDRAMFREVWRRDGRIRRANRPHVTVSARLVGRAKGGMADALTSRHGDHYLCDELLEPALDLERRARWRHAARAAFAAGAMRGWAFAVGAGPALAHIAAERAYFGDAWLLLEERWPLLARRRLRATELAQELVTIQRLLADHRGHGPATEAIAS